MEPPLYIRQITGMLAESGFRGITVFFHERHLLWAVHADHGVTGAVAGWWAGEDICRQFENISPERIRAHLSAEDFISRHSSPPGQPHCPLRAPQIRRSIGVDEITVPISTESGAGSLEDRSGSMS